MDDDRPNRPHAGGPLPPPPSGGGLRQGPMPSPRPAWTTRTGRTAGALMLIGGGLTAVALFLPRFSVSGLGGRTTVTGVGGVGVGLLILAGFAVARGLATVRPDLVPVRFAFPLLTGALMTLLLFQRWSDLRDALDTARALPGIEASIGIGFWLTALGTALVVAGGAMMQFGPRRT